MGTGGNGVLVVMGNGTNNAGFTGFTGFTTVLPWFLPCFTRILPVFYLVLALIGHYWASESLCSGHTGHYW